MYQMPLISLGKLRPELYRHQDSYKDDPQVQLLQVQLSDIFGNRIGFHRIIYERKNSYILE